MPKPFTELEVGDEFYLLYNGEKIKALKVHPIPVGTHKTYNAILLESDLAFRAVRCPALEDTWLEKEED